MRIAFRQGAELRLSLRAWLRTAAWALRDRQWRTAGAALVFAAAGIRWRVSLLGELPPWVWLLAMLVASAGCGSAESSDAPIAASLVSALGAFAYALRVRVTSDARTQNAVLSAMANYRADAETAADAARVERHKRDACEQRCDALVEDLTSLRELLHGTGYRLPPMRSKIGGSP